MLRSLSFFFETKYCALYKMNRTPVHWAAFFGHVVIMRLLLAHAGLDLTTVDAVCRPHFFAFSFLLLSTDYFLTHSISAPRWPWQPNMDTPRL